MPSLSLRIDLDGGERIGPGKIALLKAVGETGSISAAGRALHMSYRRAWRLIEELNTCFKTPLVTAQTGGRSGGGAALTPLGKSVIDFRCWYLGDGNKCNDTAYAPGWEAVAQRYDKEWGCRRPYLIVISDGGDSCAGENPCADTANLNSKGGIRTWVLAYGANCNSVGNPLKCMAQNGKGELVCPQTANDLKAELQRILGLIREEARSFASAAGASCQCMPRSVWRRGFSE